MATHTSLPIYKVAYDLIDVVTDFAKNMPRPFQRPIGSEITSDCIRITILIFRANVAQDKEPHLLALIERLQVVELMIDCALASDGRASMNSVNIPPSNLIERAAACGIDADRIRNDIEAEKASKAKKAGSKKTAPPPTEAPLGGEPGRAKDITEPAVRLLVGDIVRISAEANGLDGCSDAGVITGQRAGFYWVQCKLGGSTVTRELAGDHLTFIGGNDPTPTQAAPASDKKGDIEMDEKPSVTTTRFRTMIKAEYAHPDNPELCWTGRGRKPKWVENWLKDGGTLDQLRVPDDQDQSSAGKPANETPCAAHLVERCTKTLELPLA